MPGKLRRLDVNVPGPGQPTDPNVRYKLEAIDQIDLADGRVVGPPSLYRVSLMGQGAVTEDEIRFQPEHADCVTEEALLAVVADRLRARVALGENSPGMLKAVANAEAALANLLDPKPRAVKRGCGKAECCCAPAPQ